MGQSETSITSDHLGDLLDCPLRHRLCSRQLGRLDGGVGASLDLQILLGKTFLLEGA